MKFKEFLEACEDWEGEVFSEELEESMHSFSWNKDETITEEGKKKFGKILNSEISIIHNGNIKLLDKNITQEEYDLWMYAVAGYVSVKDYENWFGGDLE